MVQGSPSHHITMPHTEIKPKRGLEEAITKGYDFSIAEVMGTAWSLVKGMKLPFFLGLIIIIIINSIFNSLSNLLLDQTDFSTMLINIIIGSILGSLMASLIVFGLKQSRGKKIQFKEDFFSISKVFSTLVITTLLSTILIIMGTLLLVIPGIYLAISYTLLQVIIVDNPHMSAWQAMEASRKLVTQHWFKVFGLIFCQGIIILISAIPLGIGLIWTLPFYVLSISVLYETILEQ